jgi:hypothetical protein
MATLTVTHSESLTLNSRERDTLSTFQITNIDNIYERTVKCTQGVNTTILLMADTEATSDAALDVGEIKYIRLTNLDDSVAVRVGLDVGVFGESPALERNLTYILPAGQSLVLPSMDTSILPKGSAGISTGTLKSLESIIIIPEGSHDVVVEVYAAGTDV